MKVELMLKFGEIYDMLYEHYNEEKYIKMEQDAIDRYDELYKNNEMFRVLSVSMQQHRQDCFTSDREIASFMLAYEDISKVMTQRYKEVS